MVGEIQQKEVVEFNQCQEAVKRLTDYLSHELRPDEEAQVHQHLRQCKGCFSKFHFEETLLRTIRERAEQVRAPVGLRAKLMGLISRHDETNEENTSEE